MIIGISLISVIMIIFQNFMSRITVTIIILQLKEEAFTAKLNIPIMLILFLAGKIDEKILFENEKRCVRIPMRNNLRSLNLSNSVAIAVYEVLRQWNFPDLSKEGRLTQYSWNQKGGI